MGVQAYWLPFLQHYAAQVTFITCGPIRGGSVANISGASDPRTHIRPGSDIPGTCADSTAGVLDARFARTDQ